MRGRNKPWADAFINEHAEYLFDAKKHFQNQTIYLEIGMGKGDFILQSSQYYPHILHLGVEMNKSIFAIALKKIVQNQAKNILLLQVDAAKLNEYLPPSCVDKIFLNFSDPWPKKRYHKRRLVHPNQLAILEQCLKENGQIIVKTDNEELFDFGLDIFKQRGYGILEVDRDYQTIEGDFVSEYEARFRNLHQPIYRCIVQMKKKEEKQDGLNEKANSSS